MNDYCAITKQLETACSNAVVTCEIKLFGKTILKLFQRFISRVTADGGYM